MEITYLAEYKGDTWEVRLDGGGKFFINKQVAEDFSLCEGLELSGAALEQVKGADILRKAKKRGLYLLGEKSMCRGELLSKLKRTYGSDIAEEAVEYIDGLGYINDEEYAPKLAEYLLHRKRWGVRRARQDMIMRGLDRELVENVLADFSEEELDEELTALIEKKYYAKIESYDDRRRTIAALMRRGYDYSAIKRCIEAVIDGSEDDDELDEAYFDEY